MRATKRIFSQTLAQRMLAQLKVLTRDFRFSVAAGELQIINGNWYVTHTGLLRLARRKRCRGIHVEAVDSLCDSATNRFVLKATVYPSKDPSGFVGYGDADPSNVSLLVRGRDADRGNPSGQSRFAKLVKSRPSWVCVSRLASASDRRPPRFVPRRAPEGTRFVDSSSGAPVSRVLRSSPSSWRLFGEVRELGVRSFENYQQFLLLMR
jgi:hypothetical protein